jgi:S-DNA-T family DNA segregation ATPase FtsK/SpoIIIE
MARKRKKRRYYAEEEYEFLGLSPETKRGIWIVVLLTLGLLSILSFLGWAGLVGFYFNTVLSLAFGWLKILFPVITIVLGYVLLKPDRYFVSGMNYFGLVILALGLTGSMHLFNPLEQMISQAQLGQGGGWLGVLLSYPLLKFTSFWAALIILIALFLIAILITFNTTFERLAEHSKMIAAPIRFVLFPFKKLFGLVKNNNSKTEYVENVEDEEVDEEEIEEDDDEEDDEEVNSDEGEKVSFMKRIVQGKKSTPAETAEDKKDGNGELVQPTLPIKRRRKIDLPIDLLNDKTETPTAVDVEATKEKIDKTFENFGIEVEMGEYNIGPTVTQYTCRPAEGVKLNKITSLNNDLSLALAAHPIRIEAPIPGKSLVGIEVPNKAVAVVNLREVLESKGFKQRKSNLTIGLGKDVKGKSWTADLDTMPHLLIAGSTGSGKSVCINSIIISLLYENGPDDLKFIMVDPKRVELTNYNGIPHLITPVITDVKKTVNALKWCLNEMDRRFELLSKCGHRNITNHNANSDNKLPYIVFIIDELADLMAVVASDVEAAIIRLAQMARAVGIHLVLATQRPSVDVITGLIKANITSRIAFSVASSMDSRTILDTAGAEKLVGRGDMLYISSELSKPKRLQGALVTDGEIKKVVDYLKEHGSPDYADEIVEKATNDPIMNFEAGDEEDELFEEAKEIVIRAEKASASLLQRRLKIGYARAARLLDIMEEHGIIGPSQGAKPREVLVGEEALSVQQTYGGTFSPPDDAMGHEDDETEISSPAGGSKLEIEDNDDDYEESEEDNEDYEEEDEEEVEDDDAKDRENS